MKILPILFVLLVPVSVHGAVYASNGNTGFGGVLDSLEITDDGTTISFTLTTGNNLNDAFILYIDAGVVGPNNTGNFTDFGDGLRRGISGFDGTNRSLVNLPASFAANYALGLEGTFAGLWAPVENGTHTFVATANGSPGGSTAGSYTMNVALADLGLSPGDSFDFVGTYLNPGNAFRSDEAFGTGIGSENPGYDPVTFTGALTYTTVPEPSVALVAMLGLFGFLRRRR
jgi:hypothetical protein